MYVVIPKCRVTILKLVSGGHANGRSTHRQRDSKKYIFETRTVITLIYNSVDLVWFNYTGALNEVLTRTSITNTRFCSYQKGMILFIFFHSVTRNKIYSQVLLIFKHSIQILRSLLCIFLSCCIHLLYYFF